MIITETTPSPEERQLIADICRCYFIEEKTKSEIAEQHAISRFKVAELIKVGRELGIVRIGIVDPAQSSSALESRLMEAYSLDQAAISGPAPATDLEAVGAAGADLLLSNLSDGSVLGMGWGSSVFHVVRAMQSRTGLPQADVVQLAGGVEGLALPLNAIGLATVASQALGGRLYSLHAPAFVDDPLVVEAFRQEASVQRTMRRFSVVDVAISGIGGWTSGTSALRQSSALSQKSLQALMKANVCADVLMHFTDSDGRIITAGPAMIGPSEEEARQIPVRIAAAAGTEKVPAIRAALLSGLVTALATDAATALELVNLRRARK